MAYSDTSTSLREALERYSHEEERIAELYEKAYQNEKEKFRYGEDLIHYTYGMDRNAAFVDNARNDRSFNQFLAARGLGFSGEAAQAKLNSNILLSNRLKEIGIERGKSTQALVENFNDNVTRLKTEEAEKMKAISDSKNQLMTDIAAMELENESEQARLKAEQAKLEAEQAMQSEKLKAEKEMFYAELAKKYENAISASGSGGTKGSGTSGGKVASSSGENSSNSTEKGEHTYIPDISAESLAKQLVSNATKDDKSIKSYSAAYSINRFLVDLYEKYDVDYDYFNEVIFMLSMHGFKAGSYPEIRVQMLTYESKLTYNKAYDDCYERFLVSGMSEMGAKAAAKKEATYKSMMYIYNQASHRTEFEKCCYSMGFKQEDISSFLDRNDSAAPSYSGGSNMGSITSRAE